MSQGSVCTIKRWLPKNINPSNRINRSRTTDFLQFFLGCRWFVSCTCCTAGLFCITSCILKLPGCEDCQQKSSRDQECRRDATNISFKWDRQCNESMKYWWRMMFFVAKFWHNRMCKTKTLKILSWLTIRLTFLPTRNKHVPPKFRACFFHFSVKIGSGMFLFHVWMGPKWELKVEPSARNVYHPPGTFGWCFCDNHVIFEMQKFLAMLQK